jgi:hypothetical protein
VLLLFSTSFDTTVDLIIQKMGTDGVFRYNFDLWRDYKFNVTRDGFRIEDPCGRAIDSDSVTKFLWRKPARTKDLFPDEDMPGDIRYYEEEIWYALREIVNLLWAQGKVVLVEPFVDVRVGKFVQLEAARHFFKVPAFQFGIGVPFDKHSGREYVTKSLTFETIGPESEGATLFTTRVDTDQLSPEVPWFIQECIMAETDVTVQVVRDRVFAFELDRRPFMAQTVDWRELAADETSGEWRPHALPEDVEQNVFAFMDKLGLHFGRLDFLLAEDVYHFLEVNPNGQWGWLDVEEKHGLLNKVIEEISPSTRCTPVPIARDIVQVSKDSVMS